MDVWMDKKAIVIKKENLLFIQLWSDIIINNKYP